MAIAYRAAEAELIGLINTEAGRSDVVWELSPNVTKLALIVLVLELVLDF